MDPANAKPDVLGKLDALLTRHRTGAPTLQDIASVEVQAARATIPVLTEIIPEDRSIPVLTEAMPAPVTKETITVEIEKIPLHIEVATSDMIADIPHDEASLLQIEEFLVQDLENRIALEFTATLERALNELLDHSREHIRHAVREALKRQPGTPPHGKDQP
jgi:hypothetical protein